MPSFRGDRTPGRKLRRRSLLSQLLRLEDRLTPAIAIMGPHSPADLQILADTRGDTWTPLLAAPTLSAGQASYFDAPNAWYFELDQVEWVKRLNQSPFEFEPGYDSGSFVMAMPRPDGTFQQFRVWEVSMMEEGLADLYPTWKTFRGQGIDDPTAQLAADFTDHGFHAQVRTPSGHYYIDPYVHLEQSSYIAYYRSDLINNQGPWECLVGAPETGDPDDKDHLNVTLEGHDTGCGCGMCAGAMAGLTSSPTANKTTNGTTLRTYRTAVATTGEYTAFHGGTVALGQAAVVTAINRVSGVYEDELAVRLVLVANNDDLVYTDAASDPYSNTNGSAMLSQNQTTIDSIIGSANYDIGHVFSTGGGGVAGLGVVGVAGSKARGVTGQNSPIGDPFYIDYVAHEMGHQYGANHSFNGVNGNRNGSTAYEPGSGSTIMSYAGIMGSDNLQSNSDPYFNQGSLDEISNYIFSGAGSGAPTATGNTIPTVDAGASYTIPALTPFVLTGTGSDGDGDALTYSWEQRNLGASQAIVGQVDNGSSPLFRVWNPTSAPTRYFPRYSNVLANTLPVGEIYPSTTRSMTFRLTARDNRAGGGAYAMDDTTVNTVATGSAFAVTSPNTAVTWTGGGNQTVTWDVAGTTGNGINTSLVDILLSTNGGNTFTTVLAAGTPNDGSETIALPNTPTSQARIMVRPVGNIYYDVSNVNFTIIGGSSFNVSSVAPASASLVTAPFTQVDVTFSANVNVGTVGTNDLSLSSGSVTAAQVLGPNIVRYTLSGLNTEGAVTLTMPTNAVFDTGGNGVNSFVANYDVDYTTTAFPTLLSVGSRGTMHYSGTASGIVQSASDTDAFTVSLEAGQTVSVVLTGGATLRGAMSLTGPGGVNASASASVVGGTATLSSVAITTPGLYTLAVSSLASTTGSYTARLDLNTNLETAALHDSIATAQAIASSYSLGGGASVATVRGRSDAGIGNLVNEVEGNNTIATANDAAGDFTAVTSAVYAFNINGTSSSGTESDYYNLGAMQVGDILTITISGVDTGRGTNTDPYAWLYRAGQSGYLIRNDDRVAGTTIYYDSVIFSYTVTTADTYYFRANSASGAGGTYQAAIVLQNTSTAPTLGTGIYNESAAANGTVGTAEASSGAWRRVNYNSAVNGSIGSATDVDFIKYTFTAGDLVHATVTSGGTADTALAFFNAAGTLLFDEKGVSDAYGANSAMYGYRIPASGDYFFRVSSTASTTGSYSLSVDLSASTPPPAPAVGYDYYSFAVNAGEPLTLGVDALAAGALNVELLDAGNVLLSTGLAGATNIDRVLSYVPTATGTLYARVSGTANVDYQLMLSRGAALDTEANNSFATAQLLGGNRGVGSVDSDDDWYRVTLSAGQSVTIETTTPGDAAGEFNNFLDPILELWDPSNNLVSSDDNSATDGRNAKLTATAGAAGEYRVRVRNVLGTVGEYTVSLSAAAAPLPEVSSIVVDDGSVQRSRVRTIDVSFNQVVTLPGNPADAFQLVRTDTMPNDTVTLNAAVSTVGSQTKVTLSFSGPATDNVSLADGRFTLTVLAAQVNGPSGAMPANVTNNLHRLFGDADGDATVTSADFVAFRLAFLNPTVTAFDQNNDGAVDSTDFLAFRLNFLNSV